MKKLLLPFLFLSFSIYSQIPSGYYDTATGTGYTLKTQLYNIILGHIDNGYTPGLWITYQTSDRDLYYENDNTILDIYSEDPSGTDPYNFTYSSDQCGTYASEGDCYNREHIIPQSVFNENSPMRNDAHFIVPTDGKVNGYRSNYPHGMVGTATYTSQNGSKLGSALNSGYSAGYTGTVFEPIDEFKGDVARMYFYFATRYENVITSWGVSYDMFNGTTDQVFSEPFLTILMTWHTNDPVSTREIDRNNAIYARQNNRNPFIDHPEYVAQIWSTTPDTQAPTAPTNLIASNITNTTVDLNWTASSDDIGVTSYDIFVDGLSYATSATNSATLTGLTQNTSYSITVYAKDAFGNTSNVSNTENITTTNVIDITAPSIPTNLIVSNETSSTIDLSWTASTDNVEVKEYDVYVNGSFNASTLATAYTVEGLSPSTTYNFSVLARDTSNNVSTLSTAVNGTTTAAPTGASELFISEYVEGSSNNKAIEIANFTGNSITDLSIYSIKKQVNGAGTWVNKLNLSGTLANGSVYVIANSNAASTITDLADQTIGGAPIDFNGNDPVGLFKNDVLIDIVGTFNGGSSNFADNITLRRNSLINSPNITYTLSEWDSYTVDNIDDLGSHNILLSVQKYLENLFSVYPNPTSTKNITISVKNNTEVKSIQLFNLAGQLILNFENPQILQNKIELKNIPSGFYILKVFNDTAYSTKRLIVE
jgi:endonuclease I/chitodextrinase